MATCNCAYITAQVSRLGPSLLTLLNFYHYKNKLSLHIQPWVAVAIVAIYSRCLHAVISVVYVAIEQNYPCMYLNHNIYR